VWDVAAAGEVRVVEPMRFDPRDPRAPAVFDPSGDAIALITPTNAGVVVDGTRSCRLPARGAVIGLALAGGRVAWSEADGRAVHVGDAGTCRPTADVDVSEPVNSVALGPRGELAVAAGRSVRLHDPSGATLATWSGLPGVAIDVRFHPDRAQLVVVTKDPARVVVGAYAAGPAARRALVAGAAPLTDVAIDADRGRILASSVDHHVYVWDERTGARVQDLVGTGPLWGVRLSPDGRFVVGVGGVAPVVFDAETGRSVGALEGHKEQIGTGGFVSSTLFAGAARDGTAYVWDVTRLLPVMAIGDARAVAVRCDGSRVLWRGETGTRIWRPPVHHPPRRCL
jgi:WD40 repeat protein